MTGDCHVRFYESREVRFPPATHQAAERDGLAREEPSGHRPRHANQRLLAEHGRDLLGIITRLAIRRGTFDSVRDLKAAISTFIAGWNDRCETFIWTKDADTIAACVTAPPTTGCPGSGDITHYADVGITRGSGRR